MQMQELYPLKFTPRYQDRVWGGHRIRTMMGLDFSPMAKCAEAWILSGYQGFQTAVSEGLLEGSKLSELVEVYMDDLVGGKVYEQHGDTFPLLVKFIDAREWLSIQVHPDDQLAQQRNMPHGKTEMWYVIDAEKGSQLISGFNKKIDEKVYLDHLGKKTLPLILNYVDVEPGDVYYMPAGRIHSLGPGVLVTEIQQASDATYRIYDWDRAEVLGNPRELHVKQALEAINYNLPEEVKRNVKSRTNETVRLVDCPYFTTNLVELAQPLRKNYEELESFVIYLCLDGMMMLKYGGEHGVSVKKGEIVLIPAILDVIEIYPEKHVKFLEIFIA